MIFGTKQDFNSFNVNFKLMTRLKMYIRRIIELIHKKCVKDLTTVKRLNNIVFQRREYFVQLKII